MAIPVTIVGGYLGAGKTTLVNSVLARSAGLRIAVLVNDFGSVNIDSALIAARTDDIISLTNGCVCCAIQDDLGSALDRQVKRASPPDCILIEMSGVGEPGRVLPFARRWPGVKLDALVTLVDAETVLLRLDDKFVGRVVRRQIEAADFVIINKMDLVTDNEADAVANKLSCLAPRAKLLRSEGACVDPALLLGQTIARDDVPSPASARDSVSTFHSRTMTLTAPLDVATLRAGLAGLPDCVHRVKGYVTEEGTGARMLVQMVGRRLELTQNDGSAIARDVLVAIATRAEGLDAVTEMLTGVAGRCKPH